MKKKSLWILILPLFSMGGILPPNSLAQEAEQGHDKLYLAKMEVSLAQEALDKCSPSNCSEERARLGRAQIVKERIEAKKDIFQEEIIQAKRDLSVAEEEQREALKDKNDYCGGFFRECSSRVDRLDRANARLEQTQAQLKEARNALINILK